MTADSAAASAAKTPPVCEVRGFAVYEIPGGPIEVHLTADGGKTIAWRLAPKMARALGLKTYRTASAAIRSPLPKGPAV